jgi:hypothetical protein
MLGGAATALAWYDPLGWRADGTLQAEVAALAARLEAADAEAKALAERLAALEAAPDPVSASALAAVEAAVKANEAALAELKAAPGLGEEVSSTQVAALAEAVAELQQQVASQPTAPTNAAEIAAAVDAALADRAAAQEAEAQATVEAARAEAARIDAVEQLRAAARSGAPYADLLPALDGLPIAPALRDAAGTGLVTLTALTAAFPDAARTALDASLRAEAGEGLGDRLYSFLRIQTGARSLEPRDGTDPDAVLSRAEAAVEAGQIQVALDELAGLPPDGLAQMAEWSAQAQAWLAAEQALNDLAAAAGLQGG